MRWVWLLLVIQAAAYIVAFVVVACLDLHRWLWRR